MNLMDSMKAMMMKQAAKLVANVVRTGDVDQMAGLFSTLSKLAKEPVKSGLKKMAEGAKEHDPMYVSWSKLFQKAN
ncbi:MAG TPA: radical SAM protein, partial [Petrotogaceae bacterium]|nr:radical SAM protein [Petrotogaceae bacterium]